MKQKELPMKYVVQHISRYGFENAIFLEPHLFRFFPRQSRHCRLLSYELEITPKPAGSTLCEESSGTIAAHCWFEGLHHTLEIRAGLSVEIVPHNPFGFFITSPENTQLPLRYDDNTLKMLATSLETEPLSDGMRAFSDGIFTSAGGSTVPFITSMTAAIASQFRIITREDGPPWAPGETFAARKGSCRDVAWLQIHLLRNRGIAARFVSGYCYLVTDGNPEWELHAWVEVYIPGVGWMGHDPTHGLACAMNHIPIAASPYPAHTMPVSGSFRGAGASTLHNKIHIRQSADSW